MLEYIRVKLEITEFDIEDVITTSGGSSDQPSTDPSESYAGSREEDYYNTWM